MAQRVVILGGGVIGVTASLVMRVLGCEVEIVSEQFLWERSPNPIFASLYPAASVIPHNIGGNTKELFEASHAVYERLSMAKPGIIRAQKHVELTEGKIEFKEYMSWLNAHSISNEESVWGIPAPRRSAACHVEGVGFDMLFVEMPAFKAWLKDAVDRLGIKTQRKKVDRQFLLNESLKDKVLCNCLGFNGYSLCNDDTPMQAIAGILVSFPIQELLKNPITQTPISYNYLFEGVEAYSYPRSQDVLLGGTRIPVDASADLMDQLIAYFQEHAISYTWINTIPVPNYIIEVNQELYQQLYNVTIPTDQATAMLGIRPVRQDGPRLERTPSGIIHSYGYGGAGVTLAWGAALDVARLAGFEVTPQKITQTLVAQKTYSPKNL